MTSARVADQVCKSGVRIVRVAGKECDSDEVRNAFEVD